MTSNNRPSPPPFICDGRQYRCIFKERWDHDQRENFSTILSEYFCSSKTIAQIIKDWSFGFHNSQFVSHLPFIYLNRSCQKTHCNGELFIELKSREKLWNDSPVICETCRHEIYLDAQIKTYRVSENCKCDDCIYERKIEKENKQKEIEKREGEYLSKLNKTPIDLADLFDEDKFKLAILLRASYDPEFLFINPELCLQRNNKLMKRSENIIDLFKNLLEVGALKVRTLNYDSDWDDGDFVINGYYPLRCSYSLNIKNVLEINGQEVSQLEFQLFQQIKNLEISKRRDCIITLCKAAMLDELISYTESRCSDLKLPFTLSENGKVNFEEILEMFDLARSRNVIYTATRNVLEYKAKGLHENQKQLSYLVPKFAVSYAERVKANGWNIDPYYDRTGVSVSSRVLADVITELGDNWESTSLNEISELVELMN